MGRGASKRASGTFAPHIKARIDTLEGRVFLFLDEIHLSKKEKNGKQLQVDLRQGRRTLSFAWLLGFWQLIGSNAADRAA